MPADPPSPDPSAPQEPARRASLRQVIGAVFWSFFGVRKGHAMQQDAVTIKPLQVIIVGVVIAALLVVLLMTLAFFLTHG